MKRKGISAGLKLKVLERDKFTCQYCGRRAHEVPLEIDHIVPVSRGGANDIDNLITACRECNRGKKDRILNELPLEKRVDRLERLILRGAVSGFLGGTDISSRNVNISASVGKEQDIVPRPEVPISYAYWGDVTDKARDVAVSGDEDTIAYVTQMLKRALSLLTCKTVSLDQVAHGRTRVTNTPFMIGEHNENNLTVSPVH